MYRTKHWAAAAHLLLCGGLLSGCAQLRADHEPLPRKQGACATLCCCCPCCAADSDPASQPLLRQQDEPLKVIVEQPPSVEGGGQDSTADQKDEKLSGDEAIEVVSIANTPSGSSNASPARPGSSNAVSPSGSRHNSPTARSGSNVVSPDRESVCSEAKSINTAAEQECEAFADRVDGFVGGNKNISF